MNIAPIYFYDKPLEEFLRNLQTMLFLARSPLQLLKLYRLLLPALYRNKEYLLSFKTFLSFCTGTTPVCQECTQHIVDIARQVRETWIACSQICHATLLLWPVRNAVETAIIDWDDLIEDCVIASDPEIHDLLTQLTHHVSVTL